MAAKKLDGLGPFVLVGLGCVERARAYVAAMGVGCDDLLEAPVASIIDMVWYRHETLR